MDTMIDLDWSSAEATKPFVATLPYERLFFGKTCGGLDELDYGRLGQIPRKLPTNGRHAFRLLPNSFPQTAEALPGCRDSSPMRRILAD